MGCCRFIILLDHLSQLPPQENAENAEFPFFRYYFSASIIKGALPPEIHVCIMSCFRFIILSHHFSQLPPPPQEKCIKCGIPHFPRLFCCVYHLGGSAPWKPRMHHGLLLIYQFAISFLATSAAATTAAAAAAAAGEWGISRVSHFPRFFRWFYHLGRSCP